MSINDYLYIIRTKKVPLHYFYIIAAIILFSFFAFYYNFISDDAFIVFRYARNIANGYGMVYNIGERVEGFTSMLWVLLLAFFSIFTDKTVFVGRTISFVFAIFQIPIIYYSLHKAGISKIGKLFALSFIVISPIYAIWSLAGLEIQLYSFLILISYVFLIEKRNYKIIALMSCILIFTRPEALVLPVLFALILYYRDKDFESLIFSYGIYIIVFLILLFVFRYWYFGVLLPNTFYAKVDHFSFRLAIRGIKYVWNFFWDFGFIFYFLIIYILGLTCKRNKYILYSSLYITTIIFYTILVGGDGLPAYRFLVPTIPFFGILSGYAIDYFFLKNLKNSSAQIAIFFLVLILITFFDFKIFKKSFYYNLYYFQRYYEIPRWSAVGKWLYTNASRKSSVALVPIGAVGYYSNLYVYDMLGLVNPHIAHVSKKTGYGWAGHEKYDGAYILSQKPDYLLLGNVQVLKKALNINSPFFNKPDNDAIRSREQDVFSPKLYKNYKKKIIYIGNGYFLHFFQKIK